jgi:ferritin-like metal-binding protein YciE
MMTTSINWSVTMSNQAKIKESFEEQLKNTNEQIEKLQSELNRLTEYRVKLIGGLETLQLLEQPEEETEES